MILNLARLAPFGLLLVALPASAYRDTPNPATEASLDQAAQPEPDGESAAATLFQVGAGLLVVPSLGPALELGVRLGGDWWLEVTGWIAADRLDDDYSPPAFGVGPRLAYRWTAKALAVGASLGIPILQDDRQKVRDNATGVDEYRDFLVPGIAPGLRAGYQWGPMTIGLDAELNLVLSEYLDLQTLTVDGAEPHWESRGTTVSVQPKLAVMASFEF